MQSFQIKLNKLNSYILNNLSKARAKTVTEFYKRYMIVMGSVGHSMFLMQTHKIFLNGTAHDVSLPGFLVGLIALLSWLFYGILVRDKVLVIVNIVGALCALTTVIAILIAEA